MAPNEVPKAIDQLQSLPDDLYSVRALYLQSLHDLALTDPESAIVKIGKAGERIAKGLLEYYEQPYQYDDSFDLLLRKLAHLDTPKTILVGLRTVLKYRNQSAHDSNTEISYHDFEAAVSAFCAAYHRVYETTHSEIGRTVFTEKYGGADIPKADIETSSEIEKEDKGFINKALSLPITTFSFITAGILAWAVFRGGDSTFFLLLRIAVVFTSVLLTISYWKSKKIIFMVLSIGLALLFNPLFPVRLSRDIWKVIDLMVMAYFIFSGFYIRNLSKNPKAKK